MCGMNVCVLVCLCRFLPWPEEALTAVSSKFINEFKMACTPEAKDALKLMMGHVHVFVTAACQEYFEKFRRHVYVTPKSYLSFIQVRNPAMRHWHPQADESQGC